MIPLRRILGVTLLAALAALTSFALVSCSKNELTGEGLSGLIVPRGAGPLGSANDPTAPWKWDVLTIDSVLFTDDIDSTTLELTSFQLLDSLGHLVPGTVRFMPGNAYVYHPHAWPDPVYDVFVKDPPMAPTLSKVYYVPDRPLSGHTTYTYQLTTGVRVSGGQFRRDVRSWSFTTGDSAAPGRPN